MTCTLFVVEHLLTPEFCCTLSQYALCALHDDCQDRRATALQAKTAETVWKPLACTGIGVYTSSLIFACLQTGQLRMP